MFKSKLFTLVSMTLWAILATTCISCAHQSKETTLMSESESTGEEHVWSDSKQVSEVASSSEDKTEEAQLAAIEKQESVEQADSNTMSATPQEALANNEMATKEALAPAAENNELAPAEGTHEIANHEEHGMPQTESKSMETAALVATAPKMEEGSGEKSVPKSDATPVVPASEASREPASEPKVLKNETPEAANPNLGVTAQLKSEEKPAIKKRSHQKRSSAPKAEKKEAKVEVQEVAPRLAQSPTEAPKKQELEPKAEIKTNSLGEEEASSPQLASVEIASFFENHWLLVSAIGLVIMAGLFFVVRRKRDNDSQPI
jgi:hypothetical protein